MGVVQTKLTLRMDRDLIRRVKSYARRTGKSVSAIVADYFEMLDEKNVDRNGANGAEGNPPVRLSPVVRSLLGVMEGYSIDESDYRKHLERRHH